MYIRCGEQFAILSGPLLQHVGRTAGERKAVDDAIQRQGAICQWVDQNTWHEIFAKAETFIPGDHPAPTEKLKDAPAAGVPGLSPSG